MVNNSTQSKGSGNFFRSMVVWPLVFFAMSFAFFTWAAYDAVGTDFSNPRVVKFWKEGAEYAFITGFVLNVIRFVILSWEHARQQPDAVAARKAKEQAKSAERALQQKYKRRYAGAKHSKVVKSLHATMKIDGFLSIKIEAVDIIASITMMLCSGRKFWYISDSSRNDQY